MSKFNTRAGDTWAILSVRPCGKEGFKEIFCEAHKVTSDPVHSLMALNIARESSTRWCKECRKLVCCFRVSCKDLNDKDLWLCSSCGVHRCKHLCYVKAQYTATCNGCRFIAVTDPIVETVELTMTKEDQILTEIKKLQPVLAPDREREWPWIIKRMNGSGEVLDAACGGGFLQKYLLNLGFDVTATDFNPDAKLYAANGPEREKFVLQDLRKPLPLEWSEAFDYVLLISTVEHLENDDDTLVVKNLSKCIKPLSGSMFISFPYGNETEWRKIGNNTERFYSENGMYERLLIPAKLQVKDREVFTKEELDWPWKDIMVLEVSR